MRRGVDSVRLLSMLFKVINMVSDRVRVMVRKGVGAGRSPSMPSSVAMR